MPAIRNSGSPNLSSVFQKTASQAFAQNSFVSIASATGLLVPATSASTNIKGIIQETIASTDSDYATVRPVMIDIPAPGELFEIDCTANLTQAQVGDNFDLSAAGVVATGAAATIGHVKLIAIKNPTYVSATNPSVGIFTINPTAVFQTSAT